MYSEQCEAWLAIFVGLTGDPPLLFALVFVRRIVWLRAWMHGSVRLRGRGESGYLSGKPELVLPVKRQIGSSAYATCWGKKKKKTKKKRAAYECHPQHDISGRVNKNFFTSFQTELSGGQNAMISQRTIGYFNMFPIRDVLLCAPSWRLHDYYREM